MTLNLAPAEDSGVDTASWYRFQYAVTAARCLDLLASGESVVIEWHTDLVHISSSARLVSVKHREPSRGPWTIAALFSDGDLATLRTRWIASGKSNSCEFLTNAGMSAAKEDARYLSKLLASHDASLISEKVVTRIGTYLNCAPAEASEFLEALVITTTGGDKTTIDGILIEQAVRPLLESLGAPSSGARKAYRTILTMVQDIASGCAESATGWASSPTIPSQVRAARTVTAKRVLDALSAAGMKLDFTVFSGGVERGSTKLLRKLRAGGLGPTVVTGAPALRSNWFALEAAFRDDLPGRFVDEVQRVRADVLAAVKNVESRLVDGRTGSAMHVELSRVLSAGVDAQLPVSAADLMGCAYQMTDECTVWWSPEFDARNEAPWVAR